MRGWPRERRLRRGADFDAVFAHGGRIEGACVVCLYLGRAAGEPRVGFRVSRKVGNAVVRNRVRRVLRECTRVRYLNIPAGMDVVLVARASAAEADYATVERDVSRCVDRLRRAAST